VDADDSLLKLARRASALGRTDEAIELLQRHVAIHRDDATTRFELALLLSDRGRHAEAVEHLELVVQHNPQGDGAMRNLAMSLMKVGRTSEARMWYGATFELTRKTSVWSERLLVSNCVSEVTDADLVKEHRHYATLLGIEATPCQPRETRTRSLRVGIVSADLRQHPVASFLDPFLKHLPENGVDVVACSNAALDDEVTERIRNCVAEWHPIARLSDGEVCELVRKREVDVLIDLSGHTEGHRLEVFARRAAPMQATWLGYPNTTGVAAIDWRIVDEVTDPPGSENLSTERLLRVPAPFLCYVPPPDQAALAGPRRAGPPTYGCLNFTGKISEASVGVWSNLLRRDPEAVLLLKLYKSCGEREASIVRSRFEAMGIDGDRIGFTSWTARPGEHVDAYRDIDVALDPFPYNGTTTTCEALHAGVPVVTLPGRSHRSRVGATLLTAIGETRWIAVDEEAYVETAMALRRDVETLAALRRELPRRVARSRLGDPAAFATGFADALRNAFRECSAR